MTTLTFDQLRALNPEVNFTYTPSGGDPVIWTIMERGARARRWNNPDDSVGINLGAFASATERGYVTLPDADDGDDGDDEDEESPAPSPNVLAMRLGRLEEQLRQTQERLQHSQQECDRLRREWSSAEATFRDSTADLSDPHEVVEMIREAGFDPPTEEVRVTFSYTVDVTADGSGVSALNVPGTEIGEWHGTMSGHHDMTVSMPRGDCACESVHDGLAEEEVERLYEDWQPHEIEVDDVDCSNC